MNHKNSIRSRDFSEETKEAIISQLQMEADETAYQIYRFKEWQKTIKKLILLTDIVYFNAPVVLPYLIPLIIRMDAIDFLINKKAGLSRKMTIEDLIYFSDMYNMVSLFYNEIKSFEDLKSKYKTIKISKKNERKQQPARHSPGIYGHRESNNVESQI